MKKRILPLIKAILIISLINTCLLAFIAGSRIYETVKNKPVVISRDYDKGQSMEKALKENKPLIVWFYTDWCRYCQKFAPTFKKLTRDKEIKKSYAVAYVNAEDPKNQEYMEEYKVEGYPTVYIVKENKKELISPADLFSPSAFESLKAKFLVFLE